MEEKKKRGGTPSPLMGRPRWALEEVPRNKHYGELLLNLMNIFKQYGEQSLNKMNIFLKKYG